MRSSIHASFAARRALSCLATAIAVLGFAAPTHAGRRAVRSRFYLLTQARAKKLSWSARLPIDSVARFQSASGFIVHQDATTGHALLLTNAHVVRSGVEAGAPVAFFDGGTSRAVKVLTQASELDYALVEIENPMGPLRPALRADERPLRPGRPLFTITAYANLWFQKPWLALGGGRAANQEIVAGPRNRWAIALGALSETDPLLQLVDTGTQKVKARIAVLPNAPGMSGSPIFAKDTFQVIGLHSSGNASPEPWEESTVPFGLILDDLALKLSGGSLTGETARLVGDLIRSAR